MLRVTPRLKRVLITGLVAACVLGGVLAVTTGALPAGQAALAALTSDPVRADGSFEVVVSSENATANGSVPIDPPPTIEFPFATDFTDTDGTVSDGDKVVVSATVTDSETGVDSVIANASAFGAESVTLIKENDSDSYVGTFTVNASASAETGSYPIRIVATDTAGSTAEAKTNTLELGPGTTCVADAVSGSDDTMSLTEIQTAINWWAEGTEVPDTGGETISLTQIQSLINAWAEETTLSCS